MADDFELEDDKGLLDRIKESPRTVSALIIILIVAAAIYAFSGGDDEQATEIANEPGIIVDEVDGTPDDATDDLGDLAGILDEDEQAGGPEVEVIEPSPVSQEDLAAESQELPEASVSSDGYTEVAQPGEGITHLTRRATTRWLSENQAGYTVTNEHRVYIEDYLQNRIGSEGLSVGESKTVSFDLMLEAVQAAGELENSQLQNLTQYSQVFTT